MTEIKNYTEVKVDVAFIKEAIMEKLQKDENIVIKDSDIDFHINDVTLEAPSTIGSTIKFKDKPKASSTVSKLKVSKTDIELAFHDTSIGGDTLETKIKLISISLLKLLCDYNIDMETAKIIYSLGFMTATSFELNIEAKIWLYNQLIGKL